MVRATEEDPREVAKEISADMPAAAEVLQEVTTAVPTTTTTTTTTGKRTILHHADNICGESAGGVRWQAIPTPCTDRCL